MPSWGQPGSCSGGSPTIIDDLLDYAPIAAAGFAIPQFLPQIIKLQGTDDAAGVSWSWATLTSVNNAAWLVYFAVSGFWTALAPSSSAMLLAGAVATKLARRGQAKARLTAAITAWVALLIAGFTVAGRTGLGTLLTAAFVLQVTPSLWTAYRTDSPTGISRGTWMLIFAELSCWTIFGLHTLDPRLIILGFTGVAASVVMLARIRRTGGIGQPTTEFDPDTLALPTRHSVTISITKADDTNHNFVIPDSTSAAAPSSPATPPPSTRRFPMTEYLAAPPTST